MSADTEKKIWFPAKKYGWGWGPPNCWQGWVVIAVFIFLMIIISFFMVHHPILYLACVFILILALTVICYLKGEKPGWRWGGK